MHVARRITGGFIKFRRLSAVVLWLAVTPVLMTVGAPAAAQEPVDCDRIGIKLSDQFSSPICRTSRFRSSQAMGRRESAFAENRDYLISFHSARSGAGHTYVRSASFDQIFNYFGLSDDKRLIGVPQEAVDGFEYVTVGGKGLDSCILFRKGVRPFRSGFRAQHFGIACDKGRDGEYTPEEAAGLLSMVKDY
ncbi:MAG: hypothetical protein HKM95_17795 [Inquilinus sp.]|nr:hypothetical protein [Inquilinus sp.]